MKLLAELMLIHIIELKLKNKQHIKVAREKFDEFYFCLCSLLVSEMINNITRNDEEYWCNITATDEKKNSKKMQDLTFLFYFFPPSESLHKKQTWC